MSSNDPVQSEALALVGRLAASLPSLTGAELDELADSVEALTDAIGLQRDWSDAEPRENSRGEDTAMLPALADADLTRRSEPDDTGDERDDLLAWLAYQRHEFLRKLRDLSAKQALQWSVPPVELSVLGLVRHMRQMEAGYLGGGLSGEGERNFYGEDDFGGGTLDSVNDDIRGLMAEMRRSDAAIAACASLDTRGRGHGRTLRWSLLKMVHEYTLHAGQAHMIRFAALGEMQR